MEKNSPFVARAPGASERVVDFLFRAVAFLCAWGVVGTLIGIVFLVAVQAAPALAKYGLTMLVHTNWEPSREEFGIWPEIGGTLVSSFFALILGTLFGVAIALFLSQGFLPNNVETVLKTMVELLAAIPSVIYGLWGLFVLGPALRPVANWLHAHLGWLPLFSTEYRGLGMLPASLVLAIMILPTISALSRDALKAVPRNLKEGAMALGATRWEAILKVTLPTAAEGIIGAVVLGFGRALGETMALAMLIGNSQVISVSILSPGTTLAALLASSFPEASGMQISALMVVALVLMTITLSVNVLGSLFVMRATKKISAAKEKK